MKSSRNLLFLLLASVVAGCASTKTTGGQVFGNETLARPDRILVYDFAATPAHVPDESALTGHHSPHDTPQTPEQLEEGRRLGAEIASELAAKIQAMGLSAEAVPMGTTPRVGDLVIKGYLVSIHTGSEAKRLLIGFGDGASELKSVVEGFQVTSEGLRKLGEEDVDAVGAKSPGGALGVVGLIATGNPAGLIISTGMKLYGEESGKRKVEGRAEATASELADQLKPRFQQQGWI